MVNRRDGLFLVLAMLAVGLYVLLASQRDRVGFPLDDSWIHQVYGRNLADHGEWAFVLGQASAASTAPLYSALLAIGHLFNLSPYFWAYVLGVLALTLGAVMAARIGEGLFPDTPYVGMAAGLSVLLAWHNVWAAASGMETMLFMALSLTVIFLAFREVDFSNPKESAPVTKRDRQDMRRQQREPSNWLETPVGRGTILGIAGGLLTLTRPEGVILVGLVGLFALFAFGVDDRKRYFMWAAGVGVGWLVVIAPYTLWNYNLTGDILPATASAKIAENAPLRDASVFARYARMLLPLSAGAQLIALPGIVLGIWLTIKKARLDKTNALLLVPLAWAFAHLTVFVLRLPAPYQHGRYVMPALPPLLLYAAGGLAHMMERGKYTPTGRVISRSLALSAAAAFPAFLWIGGGAYANDVRIINTEMVETAKWVRDNVPEDELFAVHDIGALGYFAPREILDLAGLVSPEVVPFIRDNERIMTYICQEDAKWLMVLPDQRPTTPDDLRLTLAYESPYDFANQAQGGSGEPWKMRVYQVQCAAR